MIVAVGGMLPATSNLIRPRRIEPVAWPVLPATKYAPAPLLKEPLDLRAMFVFA
jgi:hypothetical protein